MALPPTPVSGIDKTLYNQLYAFEYIQIMTLSVLTWELITTLPNEIALYKKGFKPALLLLSISRYFTLLCLILDVAFNLAIGATIEFCHDTRWILPLLSTVVQFACLPLLLLRTYAIWNKNIYIASSLFVMWVGGLVIGTYVSTTYNGVPYSVFIGLDVLGGCAADPKDSWGTAPFIVNLIVDSMIFLLTLGKLMSVRMAAGQGRRTLRYILIRDGILYYVVVVAINVVNIVFFLAPGLPPLARPLIASPATIAPAIMVGRLFFNLQNSFLTPAAANDPMSSLSTGSRNRIPVNNQSFNNPKRTNIYPLNPINVSYAIDVKTDASPSGSHEGARGGYQQNMYGQP